MTIPSTASSALNDFGPGWYAILSSRELAAGKPLALQRFGLDLVAWRSAQGVHVVRDRCPHRAVKLSLGHLKQDCLVCPFHGFEFTPAGTCVRMPVNGDDAVIPKAMRLAPFPVREAHDFVFLWWGEAPATLPEIDWFHEELDGLEGPYERWDDSKVGLSRNIENQLDSAHLPFVHKRTIGRFVKSEKMDLICHVEGQRIRLQHAGNPQSYIELRLPNLWTLKIAPKVRMVVAFAPLTSTTTRLYTRYYQGFLRVPILKSLLGRVMSFSNKRVLGEDLRIIHSHDTPISPGLDGSELLLACDKAVIQYRRFRQEWQAGEVDPAPQQAGLHAPETPD